MLVYLLRLDGRAVILAHHVAFMHRVTDNIAGVTELRVPLVHVGMVTRAATIYVRVSERCHALQ